MGEKIDTCTDWVLFLGSGQAFTECIDFPSITMTNIIFQVDVVGRVVYEAICSLPEDAKIVPGLPRSYCPISKRQFKVAAATVESVQQQVGTILEDMIIVGFDIANDLKVLGIDPPPEKVRDVQQYFDAERCSQRPKHSLKNLARCVLGRSIQECPYSALVDARATMDLYLWDRQTIERRKKEMS